MSSLIWKTLALVATGALIVITTSCIKTKSTKKVIIKEVEEVEQEEVSVTEVMAEETKVEEVKEVTEEEEVEVKEENKEEKVRKAVEAAPTIGDMTLKDVLTYYSQGESSLAQDIVEKLDHWEIKHENLTIKELCAELTEENEKLKIKFQFEMGQVSSLIRTKPSRKVSFITNLPTEISHNEFGENVVFTRTYREEHIEEGINRINAVTYKFRHQASTVLQDNWLGLLSELLIMHQDLLDLGDIIPSVTRTEPNVNVIAENRFTHSKREYLNYMKKKLPRKEYQKRFLKDKNLEFQGYRNMT